MESPPRETGQTNPQGSNPSSPAVVATPLPARQRKRIPMSLPHQRLEVPEIPGYRLYWFREENVPRALDAFYEFVSRDEVSMNRNSIGGHPGVSGNTDLGTNVSIVADKTEQGAPIRLILMKLKLEFFKEDQRSIIDRNSKIMEAIFDEEKIVGEGGEISDSGSLTYVDRSRTEFRPVLNRPIRKAKSRRR